MQHDAKLLEETGWTVLPKYLVGIYHWSVADSDITYLRFSFAAVTISHHRDRMLDPVIQAVHWLSADELRHSATPLRDAQVLRGIDDYLAGIRIDLSVLTALN